MQFRDAPRVAALRPGTARRADRSPRPPAPLSVSMGPAASGSQVSGSYGVRPWRLAVLTERVSSGGIRGRATAEGGPRRVHGGSTTLASPFAVDGHLGCFHLLAAVGATVHSGVQHLAFNAPCTSGSGIAGSRGDCGFSFLGKLQAISRILYAVASTYLRGFDGAKWSHLTLNPRKPATAHPALPSAAPL